MDIAFWPKVENGHFEKCTLPKNCWCALKGYSLVFIITLIILTGEIMGGIIANSLALLADAGHVFTDSVAIIVTMIVAYLVRQTPKKRKRIDTVGGMINAIMLIGIAVWIFVEAIERFQNPDTTTGWVVILIASLGAVGNYIQHALLHNVDSAHAGHTHEGLLQHIKSDLYQSIAVIVSGIIIFTADYAESIFKITLTTYWIDPLFSFGIAFWLGGRAISLIKKIHQKNKKGEKEESPKNSDCGHHHH